MESLLKAIRRAASAQVWSQGVKLVRGDAVTGESASDSEIVLRVKAPGRAVAPTVVLYPKDLEWECDCPNSEETCAHVAAAAIALGQARQEGKDMPSSQTAGGKLVYRFRRQDGGLALDRYIVSPEGEEHRLASTLAALTSGREQGPAVSPEQADLNVDRILGTRTRGALPGPTLTNVMTVLADHPGVLLDGEPISVSRDPVLPRAVVEDHEGGARVIIEKDPGVTETVAFGLALCGRKLHPVGELELSGGMLERLPRVFEFDRSQIADMKTRFVPDLARRIDVDVRARKLPKLIEDARPRIDMKIEQQGRALVVLPTLVYGAPGEPIIARIDGERMTHIRGPVPVRDREAERLLVQRLRDVLHLAPGRQVTYEGNDAGAFMKRYEQYQGKAASRESGLHAVPLVPHLRVDGDSFDLAFETEPAGEGEGRGQAARHIDAGAVLRAWQEGLQVMLFDAGGGQAGWAALPLDWLERFGPRVADLLAARDQRGQLPRHALPDLGRLCEELDHPPPPGLAELLPLFERFEALPEPALPRDLRATLRPYQRTGVSWLSFLGAAGLGGVLADDMGLGKTLQALCAIRGKTLVVCPTSVIHNWADEARRFRPGLSVCVYHGPRRTLDPDADLVLTTYAILRLDSDALLSRTWDTAILDEAQAIKNPDSQVSRAAYRLDARFRMTLSGTPVENRLDELWSQLHFTNPGLLGGRQAFKERYADPIGRGDADVAGRLRARIRPFLLRRLKRVVAPELPPRTDMVLHCELDERERAVYDAVRAATRSEVLERLAQSGNVMAVLEALLRLRQAACHPGLVPGQAGLRERASSKVSALVDALELVAAEDHKALVFSQWTSLLDLIEPHLRASGIAWQRLDGSTRDRAGVVAAFQAEEGPPVMLISLKAGGTGLNLTAADQVFLCDPWWNPAVEDQAADRAHRIGQDRPVMVYRLVSQDTVEERIMALQEKKRALADAALGEADQAAGLTRDDLLALLD
jgi:superfamily II DNA or RNA helicase